MRPPVPVSDWSDHMARRALVPVAAPAPVEPGIRRYTAGDRVRFTLPVERFPHFIIDAGMTGTVTECSPDELWGPWLEVQMDEHIEGAEAWDNKVIWTPEDMDWEDPATCLMWAGEPFQTFRPPLCYGLPFTVVLPLAGPVRAAVLAECRRAAKRRANER